MDNCFSPAGSLCAGGGGGEEARRYENAAGLPIPDNDAAGVASTIDVPDEFTAGTVIVELEVTHSFVGDLEIALEHGGRTVAVWSQQGGSDHDIRQSFALEDFAGAAARGPWTLRVRDTAAQDSGTLGKWALSFPQ